MKKSRNKILLFFAALLLIVSCEESSFMENTPPDYHVAPSGLSYASVLNGRAYSKITSNVPSINSGGIPCFYEIKSVRHSEKGELDAEYLNVVSIASALNDTVRIGEDKVLITEEGDTIRYDRPILLPNDGGRVTIDKNEMYGHGDYYFTIEAKSAKNGDTLSTIFKDAFHLNIMPELTPSVVYFPYYNNLVVGAGMNTAAPNVPVKDAENVTFELATETEKLVIDENTGVLSLNPSYTVTENDTILPAIRTINSISGEEFVREDPLVVIISNTPVADLPKVDTHFFYPYLRYGATNADTEEYEKYYSNTGSLDTKLIWKEEKASNLAAAERPADISGNKSLSLLNIVWNQDNKAEPMTSWLIMDPQNIANYSHDGYDVKATFWLKHTMLFYMEDGRTPADIEVYITDTYTGLPQTTSWTKVNDLLKCEVNNSGDEFMGLPYPGDQTGDDPDGVKDDSKSYVGKWMRCELDLDEFKDKSNLTLAFKYVTYFEEPLTGGPNGGMGQAGKFWISDVNFRATEK